MTQGSTQHGKHGIHPVRSPGPAQVDIYASAGRHHLGPATSRTSSNSAICVAEHAPDFKKRAEELEKKHEDRYHELIRPISRHVEEVLFGRMGMYENIRQSAIEPDRQGERIMIPRDPFAFVALDKVKVPLVLHWRIAVHSAGCCPVERLVDAKR